MYFLGISSLLL